MESALTYELMRAREAELRRDVSRQRRITAALRGRRAERAERRAAAAGVRATTGWAAVPAVRDYPVAAGR